jgi:3-phosphoshikimate 1-carboxyvinyltransferase
MTSSDLPDPYDVLPLDSPPSGTVQVPGSKSITNRALVCAALAGGRSTLRGVLESDDTTAMLGCIGELGCRVRSDPELHTMVVEGLGGAPVVDGAVLDARSSGTTARFVAPMAVVGGASVVLDGSPQLRRRPMGDMLDALGSLGVSVEPLGAGGHLPVTLGTDGAGVRGGDVSVRSDVSSQFLSGLLLAGPVMAGGLRIEVPGSIVSMPYVEMTSEVMRAFGADVEAAAPGGFVVAPGGYRPIELDVEPDASAASYFFALAAILGGTVRIEGLGADSMQGDLRFVDVLERMGATVRREAGATEVEGTGVLRGITVDMGDVSDTAQTLAIVAAFAEGPTTVEGIGFIRAKETDRVAAVVEQMRRLGIDASEDPDGFTIRPGTPKPGVVQTYDDHRMAMSFAVMGLCTPGISIENPRCVDKTFPGFWDVLDGLRSTDG